MLRRVKKGDKVVVLRGRDCKKDGLVIDIDLKKDKVLVKGVNIVSKHRKARKSGEKSKILKEELFFPLCKVMPICPSCNKGCRVGTRITETGVRLRICRRCKESF